MTPAELIERLLANADLTERAIDFMADEEQIAEAREDIELWRASASALQNTLTPEEARLLLAHLWEGSRRWDGIRAKLKPIARETT